MAKIEEVSWRQKSRYLWLREGDKSTKFFQRVANSHRRSNQIDKLQIEEEISDDKDDIKAEIFRFYQTLYTEERNKGDLQSSLKSPVFSKLKESGLKGILKRKKSGQQSFPMHQTKAQA